MNICIFCSAMELEEKYTKPALTLVRELAEAGHTIVWGGSASGLMKKIADTAKAAGGKLIGISLERFKDVAYKDADELLIAKTLGERKAALLERSDALVVLVGGMGTLDEATEVMELKKHGAHEKRIIFLNTNDFYAGLRAQLKKMDEEGFLPVKADHLASFAATPKEVVRYLA